MSTSTRRGPKQSKWASWQQLKAEQQTPTSVTIETPKKPEPVVEVLKSPESEPTTATVHTDDVVPTVTPETAQVKKFNKKKDI